TSFSRDWSSDVCSSDLYAFGGEEAPAPAPAPAPVAAPAPLDSDGDGVTDDKDKCPNTPRGREVDENGCEYHLKKSEEMKLDVHRSEERRVGEAGGAQSG